VGSLLYVDTHDGTVTDTPTPVTLGRIIAPPKPMAALTDTRTRLAPVLLQISSGSGPDATQVQLWLELVTICFPDCSREQLQTLARDLAQYAANPLEATDQWARPVGEQFKAVKHALCGEGGEGTEGLGDQEKKAAVAHAAVEFLAMHITIDPEHLQADLAALPFGWAAPGRAAEPTSINKGDAWRLVGIALVCGCRQ
jgi:hypothetical protein